MDVHTHTHTPLAPSSLHGSEAELEQPAQPKSQASTESASRPLPGPVNSLFPFFSPLKNKSHQLGCRPVPGEDAGISCSCSHRLVWTPAAAQPQPLTRVTPRPEAQPPEGGSGVSPCGGGGPQGGSCLGTAFLHTQRGSMRWARIQARAASSAGWDGAWCHHPRDPSCHGNDEPSVFHPDGRTNTSFCGESLPQSAQRIRKEHPRITFTQFRGKKSRLARKSAAKSRWKYNEAWLPLRKSASVGDSGFLVRPEPNVRLLKA